MPTFTVTTVCLPKAIPAERLAGTADAVVSAHQLRTAGPAGHFLADTRLRTGKLLQPCQGTTAGGPVKLLDLNTMREQAHHSYLSLWYLWNQVVTGSPSAKPWWCFYDRYVATPTRFSLQDAQNAYLAQTRVTRMRGYNSHPGRLADLPIRHLEAFEAGPDAYASYGWLSAVPGHAMITLGGQLLRPHSVRLDDHWSYLEHANAALTRMARTDHLVAIATH